MDISYDFRSDTVTQPTEAMKRAMFMAEVGDDVFGDDPTVNRLQDEMAVICGKEAALFFPSGSMANLAAMMVHAQPGSTLYAGANSHVKLFELGSYAKLAGLNLVEIEDRRGYLEREVLAQRWFPDIYYLPRPGLIAVENTQNILGGLLYPVEELASLRAFAQEKAVPLHMDGARIFHAAAAADLPVTAWTQHVDSVMVCISKGLGAPVGSLLAGSTAFIAEALRVRKLLGGGMRQVGILAQAGLYALEHHLPLLVRDNQACDALYRKLRDLDFLEPTCPPTNILMVRLHRPQAKALCGYLDAQGLKAIPFDAHHVRFVFHLNLAGDAGDRLAHHIALWGQSS